MNLSSSHPSCVTSGVTQVFGNVPAVLPHCISILCFRVVKLWMRLSYAAIAVESIGLKPIEFQKCLSKRELITESIRDEDGNSETREEWLSDGDMKEEPLGKGHDLIDTSEVKTEPESDDDSSIFKE
uniref:Ovule protein n=1 Tax=Ascaris lumbricoides TaxID=6252 RepID=A0A0M3IT58_ASCLU